MAMLATPGHWHDSVVFEALSFGLLAYWARMEWRKRLRFLAGGKGYDAERVLQACRGQNIVPVIARRRGPNGEDRSDPDFNRALYRQRNPVERCFGRLKEYRRVATRYEKRAATYQAMVQRAMVRGLAKAS